MISDYYLMPTDIKIANNTSFNRSEKEFFKISEDLEFSNINILKDNKENAFEVINNFDIKSFKKTLPKYQTFPDLDERIKKILTKPYLKNNLPKKNPIVMGVLNLTKDSFYDGGKFDNEKKALTHAYKMLEEGADIIDIGAESTRPGASKVTCKEEVEKILPIVKILSKDNIMLSCDTRNSSTMEIVLDTGVNIINDISGLNYDRRTTNILKKYSCTYILTHSKGEPDVMQNNPFYNNAAGDIYKFFKVKTHHLVEQGFPLSSIIIDPGIGFGKNDSHNFNIIKFLSIFLDLGLPILIGLSRKSLIGRFIKDTPENSLSCSIVLALDAYLKGANILRVHDVKETLNAINIIKHANF